MTTLLDSRQRAMLAEMGIRWAEALGPEPARRQTPGRAPAPQAAAAPRVAPSAAVAKAESGPVFQAQSPSPPRDLSASQASPVEAMQWEELRDAVARCRACPLCTGRRNTVFGVGDPQADWLIVGEAPGENEDLQGEPFVGAAGKLLDNMLKAIHLARNERVYIANVLKCRPPANRNPLPQEVAQCEPFLRRQIQLLQPRIILAMGRFAVQTLLGSTDAIGKLRGRIHRFQETPVVVTYHPAYLLRNPADKARAWDDLCLALDCLERQAG